MDKTKILEFNSLISFLQTMESLNLLSDTAPPTTVIYADDDFESLSAMQRNFTDMGLSDRLICKSDGQQVIDYLFN